MSDLQLTLFESKVLKWLLAGEDPVLCTLRKQLASARIVSRERTGHGFYLRFSVAEHVDRVHQQFRIKPDFCFGDIEASIDTLEHGAGFLLWVRDGALDLLEGYTYDEQWPTNIRGFTLRYLGGSNRDIGLLHQAWETGEKVKKPGFCLTSYADNRLESWIGSVPVSVVKKPGFSDRLLVRRQ